MGDKRQNRARLGDLLEEREREIERFRARVEEFAQAEGGRAMSDTITKILSEFSVPTLVANENGPTSAEIAMAEEIARLRAENDHLRRVGMGRPSAELHEAALAELRAENERLRARVEELERALCGILEFCEEGHRQPYVAIANTARAALKETAP